VYAAVVAEADAGVGSILSALKKQGIDEHTLAIFSSDNGPESPGKQESTQRQLYGPGLGRYYSIGETAGLKGQKRSLYAGGVRVPFIAWWPEVVPAGKVNRQSVLTAVDLLPTFVELAGAKLSEGYEPDGQSIVADLKDANFRRTKPIFWEWAAANNHPAKWPHQGVRDGKWKLLINKKLGRVELYDIEADWAEQSNLADAHSEVVEKLTQQIQTWKKSLPTQPAERCLSTLRK
jgi:arylsulfatase A-like enzyme